MYDFLFGKPQQPRPETEDERFARLMAQASRDRVQLGLPPLPGHSRVGAGYTAAFHVVTAGRIDPGLAISERDWMSMPEAQSLYVWLHVNADGEPFYIGRGRANRAWVANGGHAWEVYVRNHLGGAYHVVIAGAGLSDAESEELLDVGMKAHSHLLLNRANPYRSYDGSRAARRGALMEQDKALFAQIESTTDLAERARLAEKGIELQFVGATLHGETGRWGEVLQRAGALQYGDRYYLRVAVESLVELGRVDEARTLFERFVQTLFWLEHGPKTERLRAIIQRGTFRRRGSKKPPRGPEDRWFAG